MATTITRERRSRHGATNHATALCKTRGLPSCASPEARFGTVPPPARGKRLPLSPRSQREELRATFPHLLDAGTREEAPGAARGVGASHLPDDRAGGEHDRPVL